MLYGTFNDHTFYYLTKCTQDVRVDFFPVQECDPVTVLV